MKSIDIPYFTDLIGRLADAAATETLRHFRQPGLTADDKTGGMGFDPVTVADKAAESAIRAILSRERPDDGIFGEEEARIEGTSGLTWVIDPIDGPRSYISGLPLWGTLIALDDGTRGRIAVVDQPHIGERFVGVIAETSRATLNVRGETRNISARTAVGLNHATLLTTDAYLFEGAEKTAFEAVRDRARMTRFGTDCYAYALLAMGQVDLVIESGLNAYDIAAPKALIEAAGGVVTDWRGGDCRWGGQVVASGSAKLHAEVMALLAPAAA